MAIEIKHAFTSAKGDGGDATLVRPSNWNAAHTTSIATNKLVGRTSPGTGSFEEIDISDYMAAALAAADADELQVLLGVGFAKSGDIKLSLDAAVPAGWIWWSGSASLGKAASGATYAGAQYETLYTTLWNSVLDTYAPVSSGRGASGAADFAAGKVLTMPQFSGRTLIGYGTGTSLTNRAAGQTGGTETHALSVAELASHFHAAGIYDPTHTHGVSHNASVANGSTTGGGGFLCGGGGATISVNGNSTGVRVNSSNGLDTTYSSGSGTAHNNMQPFTTVFVKVKL
jgi:microcystin-dependent protein